jgi:hypothetical protein
MQKNAEVDRLTEKISQLETEILLSRYLCMSLIQFLLAREPAESRDAVSRRIFSELLAMAEIDGWEQELSKILTFDGDLPGGLARRRSLVAPDFP